MFSSNKLIVLFLPIQYVRTKNRTENIISMIRRFAAILLLFIGIHSLATAQIKDSVTIGMPPYTDTSCPGTQYTFWATVGGGLPATYMWYINGVATTVTQDSFFTTAPTDSNWIYCIINYTNSFGVPSVDTSNWIIVHRDTVQSRAIISLVAGDNPYCTAGPETFFVYPVRGGKHPLYQWFVNGVPVPDADSQYFTGTFADSSIISCLMVADTTCFRNVDSVYSNTIQLVRDSLTAGITIWNRFDTICHGRLDTFTATVTGIGSALAHYQWYVNTTAVTGATSTIFYTDSLHNRDSVYCILTTFDTCIRNKMQKSNTIKDSVSPILHTMVTTGIIHGANPGCLDSVVDFEGFYNNFGNAPGLVWYLDSVEVISVLGSPYYSGTFVDSDTVYFEVYGTDRTCRDKDTLFSTPVILVRESTPPSPIVSLIGDLLVSNTSGVYQWYYNVDSSFSPAGLISGATGQTYHPTTLGYYCAVLDSGYCPSAPSNIIYISLLGVHDLQMPEVNIYPNPTSGKLILDWNGIPVNRDLEITDMLGRSIMQRSIANQSVFETNLANFAPGCYLLVLKDNNGLKTIHPITVQR